MVEKVEFMSRDYATLSEVGTRFFNCEWEAWDIAKWMSTRQSSKEGGDSDRITVRLYDDIVGGVIVGERIECEEEGRQGLYFNNQQST